MAEFRGRVLYVPGKNPKPDPVLHAALLWRALAAGLETNQSECRAELQEQSFHLAAWNRRYYGRDRDAMPDFEAIERLFAGDWDEQRDRADAESWRIGVQRMIRNVADRFPLMLRALADPVIRRTIEETERYFDQQGPVGRDIRESVKAPIRGWLNDGRPVLVIGHSLGSVIAMDALWELTHIDQLPGKLDLITLGSPLGLRFTQARLLGATLEGAARYTHLVESWHNVAAVGDLIALDPTLGDDFEEMRQLGLVQSIEDHYDGVYTHYRDAAGLNPHRSYGYLMHPVVAARVAAWWWRNR